MNGYYEQVRAALLQRGFVLVRQKGEHQQWKKDAVTVTASTNMPSRHMANTIMKQAGIAHRF